MRKANKIVMATVAILLCLVLITTSISSGIFAKYVITRKGTMTLTLKKFGVTVTMEVPTAPSDGSWASIRDVSGVTVSDEAFTSTGHKITISGLKMIPGMDFPKAVKFSFSGKLNVNAQLKITTAISYDSKVHADSTSGSTTYHNYYVPANTIKGTDGNYIPQTYYMPLGFVFSCNYNGTNKASNSLVLAPWQSSTDKTLVSGSAISNAIASGITSGDTIRLKGSSATAPDGGKEIDVANNVITVGNFASGSAVTFDINSGTGLTYFHMGFYYPLEHGSSVAEKDFYNKLSTYIGEHTDPNCTVSISYIVELIQV